MWCENKTFVVYKPLFLKCIQVQRSSQWLWVQETKPTRFVFSMVFNQIVVRKLTNPTATKAIGKTMVKKRFTTNLKVHSSIMARITVIRIPAISPESWSKIEKSQDFFSIRGVLYWQFIWYLKCVLEQGFFKGTYNEIFTGFGHGFHFFLLFMNF